MNVLIRLVTWLALLSLATSTVEGESSVLITGAAGFIGFHLAGHLRKSGYKTIVGLDTFNAYYSPPLKRERAKALLDDATVEVIDGSVCDSNLLDVLFEKYNFTHVVHLAAQAGVRYSLKQPLTYIESNVKCFTILLEKIRSVGENGHTMPHLLYASSSSVYGLNEKIPFAEIDPVEKPSNLYGATKRANELMAYSYYHLFGIQSIGFRFFTVYGPWGRPDMAAYIFTERISRGEPITVFNNGQMKRDFTYVDDICAGIEASLNYKHEKPVVFNLGNNKPVEAMYFLGLIEKSLGLKADIKFEDSKAEIPITYANVTFANQELGYDAKTSIDEGVEKFITWYKNRESRLVACESSCSVGGMCYESGWKGASAKSRELSKGCTTVLYTVASTTAQLQQVEDSWNGKSCSIAFVPETDTFLAAKTEASVLVKYGNWSIVPATASFDSKRGIRLPKFVPDAFFDESVTHAVSIGARTELSLTPQALVELSTNSETGKVAVMTALRQAHYKNLYSEVAAWKSHRGFYNDSSAMFILNNQRKAYLDYQIREKYNYDNMFDSTILVHDLKTNAGHSFRCKWYRELSEWTQVVDLPAFIQVAGAFVLARSASDAGATAEELASKAEFIPISKDKDGHISYVRLLSANHYHLQRNQRTLRSRHSVQLHSL